MVTTISKDMDTHNTRAHTHTHAHIHSRTPLLTQQFKLRCQLPNCWKRESPEATVPPFPLKYSIPTKIASLGYIIALVFFLSTSQKLSLYLRDGTGPAFFFFLLPYCFSHFSSSSQLPLPLLLSLKELKKKEEEENILKDRDGSRFLSWHTPDAQGSHSHCLSLFC